MQVTQEQKRLYAVERLLREVFSPDSPSDKASRSVFNKDDTLSPSPSEGMAS